MYYKPLLHGSTGKLDARSLAIRRGEVQNILAGSLEYMYSWDKAYFLNPSAASIASNPIRKFDSVEIYRLRR